MSIDQHELEQHEVQQGVGRVIVPGTVPLASQSRTRRAVARTGTQGGGVVRGGRPVARVSASQVGILVVGLAIGGPVTVVTGVMTGDLRAMLAFPAAVVVWLAVAWWREGGWAGVGRVARTRLITPAEVPAFLAGAVVALLALAGLAGWFGGGGGR